MIDTLTLLNSLRKCVAESTQWLIDRLLQHAKMNLCINSSDQIISQIAYFSSRIPSINARQKVIISTATIVEPTDVPVRIETIIPQEAQNIDTITEHTVTEKKLWNIRIAVNAGKIISAEISSEPTRFIARTITVAMIPEIKKLYLFTFVPAAFAKSSSNVTAKILL